MSRNNKKRKIRKYGRVHIIPHIIVLILFFSALIATLDQTMDDFTSFVLDTYVEENYGKTEILSERILNSKILNSFTEEDVENFQGDGWYNFWIYDKQGNVYFTNVPEKDEIKKDRYLPYDFDENDKSFYEDDWYYYVIKNKRGDASVVSDEQYLVDYVLNKLIIPEEFTIEISTLLEYEGYVEGNIGNTDYTLIYQIPLNVRAKDIVLFFLIGGLIAGLVTVPVLMYLITLIISIIEQKRTAKVLFMDPITGGKNWLYFQDRASVLIKKNHKKVKYAVASLRMDRYQSYCLCYGAKAGELLLEEMVKIIKKESQKKELSARYAEAEFGILFTYKDEKELESRIEKLEEALDLCDPNRKMSFSCGLTKIEDEYDADSLYNNASVARKTITLEALDRIVWYSDEIKKEQLWESHVEERMDDALNNGEFQIYIQPKYNSESRTLGGGEALIRWISPEDGFIGPGKFIPIFEKNGFITKIDDYMIRGVAKLQAKWLSEGKTLVPISVNVSRAHFTRDDLAEHICKIVEEENCPKEYIELELTESAFFEDRQVIINIVAKLREYGFSVSMDDFGADYSSLNSLKDMPLDVIKLDAGFFRGEKETEERGSTIVSGIISLAKNLGMHIVAEGIEHGEQVDFLAEQGCDLIQGFYFAKPMPVEEFEKLQ